MMYKPEIILNGAPNARDLGGIETSDGRKIKAHRLIRSGALWKIDDNDVEYLRRTGLRTVVDFRTLPERLEHPDRVMDGVSYIICPMLERETDGITRTEPLSEDEDAQQSIRMAQRLMRVGKDGREQMKSLYPLLVTLEHSVEHYRRFFELLLSHEKGELLYHCSMGKDRVGTATALLLSALNVPRETIIDDYMITAKRCAPGTARLIENCRKFTDDESVLTFIYWLDTVRPEFILAVFDTVEGAYGSMSVFLREKMGLTDEKLARLAELYLE